MRLTPTAMKGSLGITPLSVGDRRAVPPRNWAWRSLTSCARLESGHTPSRYHPEWWGGQIPWISLTDILELDGKVAQATREYTNETGIANSSARVLPAGTVVLSRTASVGFVTIMGREMATSQDFVNWVCGPDLDPRFLAYLFRASRAYLRSLSSGAIHQTIYMPTVEAFDVCIPDLKEQKRIVSSLDERIGAAERARAAAEVQLEAAKALSSAYLHRLFSGGATLRWPRTSLGNIALRVTDGTHQPPPFAATGVPFLFVRNIIAGRIDFHVEKYVSQATYEELVRGCRPERGDLLYSAVGSFGVAVVIDTDRSFTFQRHIAHVKLRRDLADARFVASYLNSPDGRRQSEAAALGGAQRTVTLGALAKFEIPMPDLDTQLRAVGILNEQMSAVERMKLAAEQKMASISTLPATLLRRAFNGEL